MEEEKNQGKILKIGSFELDFNEVKVEINEWEEFFDYAGKAEEDRDKIREKRRVIYKNPFLNTKDYYDTIQFFKREDDGRSVHAYFMDLENETRVYIDPMRTLLRDLKATKNDPNFKKPIANGVRAVLLHIMTNLRYPVKVDYSYGANYLLQIDLSRKILDEELGVKKSNRADVIRYLKEKQVIIEGEGTKFWVNPKYFFAGNRIKFLSNSIPYSFNIKDKVLQDG